MLWPELEGLWGRELTENDDPHPVLVPSLGDTHMWLWRVLSPPAFPCGYKMLWEESLDLYALRLLNSKDPLQTLGWGVCQPWSRPPVSAVAANVAPACVTNNAPWASQTPEVQTAKFASTSASPLMHHTCLLPPPSGSTELCRKALWKCSREKCLHHQWGTWKRKD